MTQIDFIETEASCLCSMRTSYRDTSSEFLFIHSFKSRWCAFSLDLYAGTVAAQGRVSIIFLSNCHYPPSPPPTCPQVLKANTTSVKRVKS